MKIKELSLAIIMVLIAIVFLGKDNFSTEISQYNNRNINNTQELKTNILLVNKENPIPSNYKPKNMIKPNMPFLESVTEEDKIMDSIAAKSMEELFNTAKEEGINLIGTSAYRSYESQKRIYKQNINIRGKEEAKKYVALPGESEHQTGLAIDVTNEERWFHESTKEATWLANNAHKFGFILRYPKGKEHITGYNFEPWHVRYVGKEIAKEIYSEGITLEEYIEKQL